MLTGEGFDYHCHSNLTRAVMPYGLSESDVHVGLSTLSRRFLELLLQRHVLPKTEILTPNLYHRMS